MREPPAGARATMLV